MPSLKDLKIRIKSVKSTQKITKAMKMVAASKLRRAREAAEAARPYSDRMEKMVARLAAGITNMESAPPLLSGTGKDQVHLIVPMTADRGLCGAFNASIAKAARAKARELQAQGKTVKFLCVGKKSNDFLRREFQEAIVDRVTFQGKKRIIYADAEEIAEKILALFDRGEFDVCTIIYNGFKSVISQVVTAQQIIPLVFEKPEAAGVQTPYEYEPEEEAILADLLPRNIAVQVFHGLLENGASEQGARMTAMENATKNAGEMVKKLSLKYNRARQAAITKELIEIISGAEAL